MRILNIEDEARVAAFIKQGLEEAGHDVDIAPDGASGLDLAGRTPYDLVLLDWLLPDREGVDVCRDLRDRYPELPILMLTARDAVEDRVLGLDSGADDYLSKPFSFEELKARIRALARRHGPSEDSLLQVGDLSVDLMERRVERRGQEVVLSNREFELLVYFMRRPNRIISREELGRDVWGIDFDTGTNYVNVYLNYLRTKLTVAGLAPPIATVRGRGYILKADE